MRGLAGTVEAAVLDTKPGRSLASQLTLTVFLSVFLTALTASGILYWATIATLQYADDQVVDKRAGTVVDLLQAQELNDGLLAHEVNEDNQGPRQIFMRIISRHAPIQLETENMSGLLAPEMFPDATASDRLVPVRARINAKDGKSYRAASYRVPITRLPGEDAILQVATDTTLDNKSLSLFKRILMLVIGAALPLSAVLSWCLANRSLKPLARITAAAQQIDGGTLDQRIVLTDLPAELHELASHFNSMLARLETTWLDLKHYADTIAHELRTPLNRLRLECEIALDKAETAAEFRDVMGSAVGECERLTRLLQGLLFLARADSQQASVAPKRLLVEQELRTIGEYFGAEASEAGITLTVECENGLELEGNRELIQQAITNLLSNALAHTQHNGRIVLAAKRNAGGLEISVGDTGTGIPTEHQAHIFDRFFRAGNDRDQMHAGQRLGLGLSITKRIAELHGGRVVLESTVGKGTKVTLLFPDAAKPRLALRLAAE